MSRILVTGCNGQIGRELMGSLQGLGEVIGVDRSGMDLADPDSIRNAIRGIKPSLIINTAAYTAVDKTESEPALAMAVNGIAPGILAAEVKRINAAVIHYSTDYVFDGSKNVPYTEEDQPRPINVYGKSKLAGERAMQATGVRHLILRTSWVYGARGENFFLTMLKLAKERNRLRVVSDQMGVPNWSRNLARVTAELISRGQAPGKSGAGEAEGIYNLSAGGVTSWHGFAKAILTLATYIPAGDSPLHLDTVPELEAITTAQYPTAALRPRYTALANTKIQGLLEQVLPDWELELRECLASSD